MRPGGRMIQNGILLFWATWFTVVFASNCCDGLKEAGVLKDWKFASGNYSLMHRVIQRYCSPAGVTEVLFAGVVVWEAVAASLFWRAFIFGRCSVAGEPVYSAFGCGLALWGSMMLADEILITYDLEASHVRLLIAQLASLLLWERSSANTQSTS